MKIMSLPPVNCTSSSCQAEFCVGACPTEFWPPVLTAWRSADILLVLSFGCIEWCERTVINKCVMAKTGGFANSPKRYGQFVMVCFGMKRKSSGSEFYMSVWRPNKRAFREVNFLTNSTSRWPLFDYNKKMISLAKIHRNRFGKTKKQISFPISFGPRSNLSHNTLLII